MIITNEKNGIRTCFLNDWQEFMDLKEVRFIDTNCIWRGQSNNPDKMWEITPSFYRHQSYQKFHFSEFVTYLFQEHVCQGYFSTYSFPKKKEFFKLSTLGKIYVAQHYGIPTCFIDFTKNPLVALYFAMAGVGGTEVIQLSNKKLKEFPDGWNMTLYKLNISLLSKYLGFSKTIGSFDIDSDYPRNYYMSNFPRYPFPLFGFDESPEIVMESWRHGKLQESCFLFFEPSKNDHICFYSIEAVC